MFSVKPDDILAVAVDHVTQEQVERMVFCYAFPTPQGVQLVQVRRIRVYPVNQPNDQPTNQTNESGDRDIGAPQLTLVKDSSSADRNRMANSKQGVPALRRPSRPNEINMKRSAHSQATHKYSTQNFDKGMPTNNFTENGLTENGLTTSENFSGTSELGSQGSGGQESSGQESIGSAQNIPVRIMYAVFFDDVKLSAIMNSGDSLYMINPAALQHIAQEDVAEQEQPQL